jgi:hypothetical protein
MGEIPLVNVNRRAQAAYKIQSSTSRRNDMLRLLLVSFLLLSGCTFSTNPIHMNADLSFDEALVGTWGTKDIPGFGEVTLSRLSPSIDAYRVLIFDEQNRQKVGAAEGYLCQLDGKQYISLKFEGKPENKLAPKITYLTFVIDQQTQEILKLRYLNQGKVTYHLKGKPEALKHEFVPRPATSDKSDLLITAETAEFRAYIQSHLENRDFWVPMELKRVR